MAHIFNHNTREVETGVMWLGRERNIRWEETELKVCREDLWRQNTPFGLRIS